MRRIPFLLAILLAVPAGAPFVASDPAADSNVLTRPGAADGPTRVTLGLFLIDLIDVSGPDQSFQADLFIRAGWNDPRLAGRWDGTRTVALSQIWHPTFQIVNQRGVTDALPPELLVEPDGRVTYRHRVIGRFSARMELQDFPLDHQRFQVRIVTPGMGLDQIELVADAGFQAQSASLSISDWSIGALSLHSEPFQASQDLPPISGFELSFEGDRRRRYYVVQVILPLVMIIMMAWTVFWIDPTVVATRMSVVVTTMLTLIAYRFALGNMVPRLSYLTRLDWFLLGSTALVTAALLTMAATAYLMRHKQDAAVARIDRWGRLLFPLTFALLFAIVWFT